MSNKPREAATVVLADGQVLLVKPDEVGAAWQLPTTPVHLVSPATAAAAMLRRRYAQAVYRRALIELPLPVSDVGLAPGQRSRVSFAVRVVKRELPSLDFGQPRASWHAVGDLPRGMEARSRQAIEAMVDQEQRRALPAAEAPTLLPRPRRSVELVIVAAGSVLLVYPPEQNGAWRLPHAPVWFHRTRQAAARLLERQLGVSVDPASLRTVSDDPPRDRMERPRRVYFALALEWQPSSLAEATWTSLDALPLTIDTRSAQVIRLGQETLRERRSQPE